MSRSSWMWDQHACLPLTSEADVSQLDRYDRSGGGFVSINVGYAPQTGDVVKISKVNWDYHELMPLAVRPGV